MTSQFEREPRSNIWRLLRLYASVVIAVGLFVVLTVALLGGDEEVPEVVQSCDGDFEVIIGETSLAIPLAYTGYCSRPPSGPVGQKAGLSLTAVLPDLDPIPVGRRHQFMLPTPANRMIRFRLEPRGGFKSEADVISRETRSFGDDMGLVFEGTVEELRKYRQRNKAIFEYFISTTSAESVLFSCLSKDLGAANPGCGRTFVLTDELKLYYWYPMTELVRWRSHHSRIVQLFQSFIVERSEVDFKDETK